MKASELIIDTLLAILDFIFSLILGTFIALGFLAEIIKMIIRKNK